MLFTVALPAAAATRFVAPSGSDSSNDCTKEQTPCGTIAHGISTLAAGDTLVLGDGTYTEPITDMPSGSAGAYTTIRAANDWGVLIDGSAWPDDYMFGIEVSDKHHVIVRGVRVQMNQANENNLPVNVLHSDHVKIQRCGASYGPTTGNAASFSIGPGNSYVLVEESYAFGGSRYQFLAYQSDHVIVRRSVARNDYWDGSLQCGGFVNYDSLGTAWQNNIALDSDTADCSGHYYGGFWNENKTDAAPDTSQKLAGNIVLNVHAFYAGDLDWVVSGTRSIEDMIIWGSSGGYHGNQGDGAPATIKAKHVTIGGLSGEYNGPNGAPAKGTAFSVFGPIDNTLTSSILAKCESIGVADYTVSDYNVLAQNGANFGGVHPAAPGPHDHCAENGNELDPFASGLRYLPRVEAGSALLTVGENGGRVGAEVLNKIGVDGTLQDEPGWDQVTNEPLWPFPNEDRIRDDMASYSGPGAPGARGFATGTSLDGKPQTLTKYVWEYLGNPIPPEVYAGTSGRDDGSGGADPGSGAAAAAAAAGESDEGCGCRASSRGGNAALALFGAAALLAYARARRRGSRGAAAGARATEPTR